MSSVDDRIVNMQFNNKQFQAGAAESTQSLQTLEKTIAGMGSSSNGLDKMGQGVDGIKAKFSALQIAGVTALATIVNKAVDAGLKFVKSFTIQPLIDGFKEYEINLNSIQTILANTGLKGQKGLDKVNAALKQLNDYSDLTIYNFSQMAKNIGTFTAAGVDLDVATNSIKGMANAAALGGASVEQLNVAMYQTSQALSTGVIRLQDWNSLATAGLGNENMRTTLMQTAETLKDHGKAMKDAIKKNGDFRGSLREGWLSAEIFNKAMTVMAGVFDKKLGKTIPYTVKQLQKMGFEKGAAKRLNEISQAAIDSATKVKTFSQLIDVTKESIGSGWAKIFQNLFGDFKQATTMWTNLSEVIQGAIGNVFNSIDEILSGWRDAKGFENLWMGFANIFKVIGNIIEPFAKAFRDVFPATGEAGSKLGALTQGFADFTGWLVKITDGLDVLTPVLTAVFGVFKLVGGVASDAVTALQPLINLFGDLASQLGSFAVQGAQIGASLIQGVLEGLNTESIKMAVENFANSIVTWIKNALGIASPAAELVPVGEAIVMGIAQGIAEAAKFVFDALSKVATAIVLGIKDFFTSGKLDAVDWTALFNIGVLGLIFVSMKKLIGQLGNILDTISGPFDAMTGTLKNMQRELKAAVLVQIAIAVALLAASFIALSLVEPAKLAVGLFAMGELLAMLLLSFKAMEKIKPENIFATGAAMVAVAGAILILSGAIAVLGNLDTETLNQGMTAFGIALGIMVLAINTLSGIGEGIAAASVGIALVAGAMVLIAGVIAILGHLPTDEIGQGIGAFAVVLGILVLAINTLSGIGPGIAAASVGIFIVANAMGVLAGVIAIFGHMDINTLQQGIGALAYTMAILTVALGALGTQGPASLAAAGAIIIVAGGIYILAKALTILGQLSLGQLAAGLAVIGIAFGVLIGAAALLAPPSPLGLGMLILAESLAAIGAGALFFGAGMLAAATAFGIFVAVGSAGIALVGLAFTTFMALLPAFAVQLGTAIVLFIETIASMAPRLRVAFGTIIEEMLGTVEDAIPHLESLAIQLITSLLNVLEAAIPEVQQVVSAYITAFIEVLRQAIPDIADAALDIVVGILTTIDEHLDEVVDKGVSIVGKLIRGLARGAVTLANDIGDAVVDFLEGIADAIDTHADDIRNAGLDIARALIDGMTGGLLSEGMTLVGNAVRALANSIPGPIRKILGIESPSKVAHWWGEMIVKGLANGIRDSISDAVGATIVLANAVIAAGDKKVAEAQRAARVRQIAAERAAAKARVSNQLATRAERAADKSPNNKSLQAAAKAARKLADAQQKAATSAQKKADSAASHVDTVQQFQNADDQGKGDLLTETAKRLSDRAITMLARANADAIAARKLTGKARDNMLRQAKAEAKSAKDLADRSKAASDKANKYYARSVDDRIKAIEDERQARETAAADQEKFDNATPKEQVDILNAKADASQKRAEAALAESEALIEQAKKLAKTDAKQAQKLLDKAEELAASAEQDQQDAQSFANQAGQIAGSSTGATFAISMSALEDAAKAVDRWSESLADAELAAQATPTTVTFEQNNYSPKALDPIEIYRGTKNQLSMAEIKMADTVLGP